MSSKQVPGSIPESGSPCLGHIHIRRPCIILHTCYLLINAYLHNTSIQNKVSTFNGYFFDEIVLTTAWKPLPSYIYLISERQIRLTLFLNSWLFIRFQTYWQSQFPTRYMGGLAGDLLVGGVDGRHFLNAHLLLPSQQSGSFELFLLA